MTMKLLVQLSNTEDSKPPDRLCPYSSVVLTDGELYGDQEFIGVVARNTSEILLCGDTRYKYDLPNEAYNRIQITAVED